METNKNAISGYNRRNFLKRGLQIGTALSVSPFLIDPLVAYGGDASYPNKRRRHCRLRRNSIFDIDDFDRISNEVWNERGPFGLFLEDEVPHQGERMGPESWEDLGFYTLAQSNGEELYLLLAPMFSAGQPVISFSLSRGERLPNEVNGDSEIIAASLPEEIRVAKEKNRVIWKSPHLQLIAQPPIWHALGRYKDSETGSKVKVDLLFKQLSQEYWSYWPGLNPGRTGKGVHAPCSAEGVIRVDGKKYVIENGVTSYERCVMPVRGDTWSVGNMDWINGVCGEKMDFQCYRNDYGARQGFLSYKTNNGEKEYVNFEDVIITPTEAGMWMDPKIGDEVPTEWEVTMNSNRGTFYALVNVYIAVMIYVIPQMYIYHHSISMDAQFETPDGEIYEASGIGTNECRILR